LAPLSFEKSIGLRISDDDEKRIREIVDRLDERYFNLSHFVRCAVMKLIREEEGKK